MNLAAALLNGAWSVPAMVRRAVQAWGPQPRWLRGLARRVLATYAADATRPDVAALAEFILADRVFRWVWSEHLKRQELPLRRLYYIADVMTPAVGAPASWDVPALTSPGALAEWLGVDPAEMDWFANCQGRNRQAEPGPLQHYTYRWLVSRRRKARLLEVPKACLKHLQRRLLHDLLDRVPPHDAAHAYRAGRSIVTWVAPHAGQAVVLHLDLRQFFPSITSARVRRLFQTTGYPPPVARLLAGLCTNAVPENVLRARPVQPRQPLSDADRVFLLPHLPQGAPTSPALANLCAFRLDCRLASLSRSAGANYTRYADDLVFSGDEAFERCLRRFHVAVCRIALEEGFEVNTGKSHFMRQGVRQQVAGVVLNARPNVPRDEYDRLKATLTNCVRHGPHGQNRDGHADFKAHLAGRIAFLTMVHPARGGRLRALFERISWEPSQSFEPEA